MSRKKNAETDSFDKTIPQVHFMKLIACSFYNSWHNLNNEGSLSIVESDERVKVSKNPPGHYTLETITKQMEESLKKLFMKLALIHICLLAGLLSQIMEISR